MSDKYLSEVFEECNVNLFDYGNMGTFIFSPTGSGKTYQCFENIFPHYLKKTTDKGLYLCDNRHLLTQIMLQDNTCNYKQEALNNNFELVKRYFGRKSITVMTYHMFGKLIHLNKTSRNKEGVNLLNYKVIICDEIHNLLKYANINGCTDSIYLRSAKHELFEERNKLRTFTKVPHLYMFTATPNILYKKINMSEYNIFNFLNDKWKNCYKFKNYPHDIKSYKISETRNFSNYKQIENYLATKEEYFNDNYKVLIYTDQVKTELKLLEALSNYEFMYPITLWSVNNNEYKLNVYQMEVLQHILRTGKLLDPYNILIVNRSMETGVDIKDNRIQICIINTTDNDISTQARGRLRHNIIELYQLSNESTTEAIELNNKWLNIPLTKTDKDQLAEELKLYNSDGKLLKWNTIKVQLLQQGYEVKDTQRRIDDKRIKVSIISKNEQ